ncbi:hypothetical protein [Cellulomonas cellasea]|uniref:Uncharacterized protein n=1 Tax=Cellulomonas cellasea TaxID=43670 RepID=A0A4Y3KXF1_9CELL|nr:hypothetical protein [Cellulomonas cellasea]GEA87925.1 hypothetical protein CCE01nite_18740 [Cellulomonas cellasea]
MTCSSAEPRPGTAAAARGRTLRLVAAALVAAGGLLGASATAPDATSAVFTDTETLVATVRTVPDFSAPAVPELTAPRPVAALLSTPAATATPTPAPPEPRDDPRAPREGRGR